MRGLLGWVLACACLVAPVRAEVRAACVFGSHMVLQRERPVPVWGTAAPGEAVTVTFAGQQAAATADAQGAWTATLAPMPASAEPREMTITGAGNAVTFSDVLVGEVWLCSGQSNMVWEVRSTLNAEAETAAANYPAIRAFTAGYADGTDGSYVIKPAEKKYALTPQSRCLGAWQTITPASVRNVSAVAYFFGRELHQRLQVPVGLVVAAAGATAIEAWIGLDGLKRIPRYRPRAEVFEEASKAYLADPAQFPQAQAALAARFAERQTAWFTRLDADDPGLKGQWMAPGLDTAGWGRVTLPVSVADNPIGSPIASIWFRKHVTIPAAWVGKALELHLGVLDCVDESYVNGTRVGRTWFDTAEYWTKSRVYTVPAEAVTSTTVTVSLRLLKLAYHLAPLGPAAEMRLAPAESAEAVSLAGEWAMRKAQDLDYGLQPQAPPLNAMPPGGHYGQPGVMYNGLLHPLIPYAIRGALWYQGEANAPFYIDYRSLLPGLIAAWRQAWGQGDFPFGIVQLASYYGQQTTPVERSGYQNVREAQAMALSVPGTFMSTAMDIGEGNNIHPRNKQEVGRRLALEALGRVYGKKDLLYSGPTYAGMTVEGNTVRLRFTFAQGLQARGEPPVGFVIAGADRAYYWALARIEGETVVVWSDKVPQPVAVRYAWASNPVCNVYNAAGLPIFPFHTDDWDLSQLVITKDPITLPAGWVAR
jgi:sialate O-acetylesterase